MQSPAGWPQAGDGNPDLSPGSVWPQKPGFIPTPQLHHHHCPSFRDSTDPDGDAPRCLVALLSHHCRAVPTVGSTGPFSLLHCKHP